MDQTRIASPIIMGASARGTVQCFSFLVAATNSEIAMFNRPAMTSGTSIFKPAINGLTCFMLATFVEVFAVPRAVESMAV